MVDDKEELPGFWKKVVSHLKGLATAAAALSGALVAVWGVWTWVNDHLKWPRSGQAPVPQTASVAAAPNPSSGTPPVLASTSAVPSGASQTQASREKKPEVAAVDP
jgi:negative regulator of sigma E activity